MIEHLKEYFQVSQHFEKLVGTIGGVMTYACSYIYHPTYLMAATPSPLNIDQVVIEVGIRAIGAVGTGVVLWWLTHWFNSITKKSDKKRPRWIKKHSEKEL